MMQLKYMDRMINFNTIIILFSCFVSFLSLHVKVFSRQRFLLPCVPPRPHPGSEGEAAEGPAALPDSEDWLRGCDEDQVHQRYMSVTTALYHSQHRQRERAGQTGHIHHFRSRGTCYVCHSSQMTAVMWNSFSLCPGCMVILY